VGCLPQVGRQQGRHWPGITVVQCSKQMNSRACDTGDIVHANGGILQNVCGRMCRKEADSATAFMFLQVWTRSTPC
jgi:hypothetical protein